MVMMRAFFITAFLFFVQGENEQSTLIDMARQAAMLYEQADYEGAKQQYEALIAAGVVDPIIYANLGNTYYQLQDWGRALVYYRRTQAINPREATIAANMARIRSLRRDIQGDETAFVDSLAALTIPVMTESELTWFAFSFWVLFFGLVTTAVVKPGWRAGLRSLLIFIVTLLILSLLVWGSRLYTGRFRPPAVVVEDIVTVMSGPGETYLPLYELHAAAEMRVLEDRGDWIRFILPDQRQGWLHSTSIEVI